jgi:hypothetical protein
MKIILKSAADKVHKKKKHYSTKTGLARFSITRRVFRGELHRRPFYRHEMSERLNASLVTIISVLV